MEFKAKVLSCELQDEYYHVILDYTDFYPTKGGQLHDYGKIGDVNIINIIIINNSVIHVVDGEVEGDVICVIDESKRYLHSLMHSAQHLLSATFDEDSIESNSFLMHSDHFQIDLLQVLDRNVLDDYELRINKHIKEALNITTRLYDEQLDKTVNLGQIPANLATVVEIESIEVNLCGGTHLSNTKDILFLKIAKYKRVKDSTRIWVYAGENALKYVQNNLNTYQQVLNLLSTNSDVVIDILENKLKEVKQLKKQLKKNG